MGSGYAKVFEKILRSSIWLADSDTRVAWLTLMVLADKNGFVSGSLGALAHTARVEESKFREAVDKFLSPDPDSSTPDNDGRRLEKVDGGYLVLNHAKYSKLLGPEDMQEYWRRKKEESRKKKEKKIKPFVSKPLPGEISACAEELRIARAEES